MKTTYEIDLFKPSDIELKRTRDKINKLVMAGVHTNEIVLCMHFICDDVQPILNRFNQIKNRFAFERDNPKNNLNYPKFTFKTNDTYTNS